MNSNRQSSGVVSMGSMGSTEPINVQWEVHKPIIFLSIAAESGTLRARLVSNKCIFIILAENSNQM